MGATMKRIRRPMSGQIIFAAVGRRHIYFLAFVLLLACAYVLASARTEPVRSLLFDDEGIVTVAVDAGHGGRDPGAIGFAGTLEKDVTIAIALELEKTLEGAGLATLMTRTVDDELLGDPEAPHRQRADLIARAELVNSSDVDLFVSIHANSFPDPELRGAQTFHLAGDDAGWRLAVHIQNALVRSLGPNRRRATAADLRILSDVNVPAVVVEAGFLTNPDDEKLLNDETYQKKVAEAVTDGILEYVKEQGRFQTIPAVPERAVP